MAILFRVLIAKLILFVRAFVVAFSGRLSWFVFRLASSFLSQHSAKWRLEENSEFERQRDRQTDSDRERERESGREN